MVMSSLFESDDKSLAIDLTGTKKSHRRRGIQDPLLTQQQPNPLCLAN
jgi:hypothetical protein